MASSPRSRRPLRRHFRPQVECLEDRRVPAGFTVKVAPLPVLVTGADAGTSPQVNVYDGNGNLVNSFFAFDPSFAGGVRVAAADVNGDGVADILCAAGPGGGPQVTVFDGVTFQPILNLYAFPSTFTGGVFVAAGDVNGDGFADIICGAGAGGGPEVRVFSGKDGSLLRDFYAFAPNFLGGVTVAAGDLNGDGIADIVAGAGPGGGPQVTSYDGLSLRILSSFFAARSDFTGGVFVAAGDINGDGRAEVVVGEGVVNAFERQFTNAGATDGPRVSVFNGQSGTALAMYFAYPTTFAGGVRVGVATINGVPSVVAGAGPGGLPETKLFAATTPTLVSDLLPFDPSFTGGVFVS